MSSRNSAQSPASGLVIKSTIAKEGEASKNIQSAEAVPPQKKLLLLQPVDKNGAKNSIVEAGEPEGNGAKDAKSCVSKAGELSPADNLQVVKYSRKRKRTSDRLLLDAVRQKLDFGKDLC